MKARLIAFGELQIEGERYTSDVVIEGGRIRKRRKGPSKPLRDQFGHTPLSAAEDIPWGGRRLIVGTGADGALPITPEVWEEARRRGIAIEALPTRDACRLLADLRPIEVYAIVHVTCQAEDIAMLPVGRNLIRMGLAPGVSPGVFPGEHNTVGGNAIGECASLV